MTFDVAPDHRDWEDGEVRITVPAELSQMRIVRLAAAACADQLGFDVEEVEDVRVAVDELASCLVERAIAGPLSVSFVRTQRSLILSGTVAQGPTPELDDVSTQILGAVVDQYELGRSAGRAWFRAEKAIPGR